MKNFLIGLLELVCMALWVGGCIYTMLLYP